MKNSTLRAAVAASLLAAAPAVAFAGAPDTEVVEFYNSSTHHYFVTATASEARIVDDGGAGPGWLRTGRSFQAWLDKATAPADARPVCRFYSSGANSHFYTASDDECAGLRAQEAAEHLATGGVRGWQYEGTAFFVQVPQGASCPAGTVQLTRVYNNGFATGEGSNHRFLDDPALHDVMLDDHWVHEGAVFCAAAKPATGTEANMPPTTTSFDALVGTWDGNARLEVENAGGETDAHSALELKIAVDGGVAGSVAGCQVTGSVAIGDGFRSLFTGTASLAGCDNAAFKGANQRLRLQRFGTDMLMVQVRKEDASGETTISASLTNNAATPPQTTTPGSGAALAGDWEGTVGFEAESGNVKVEGNKPLSLGISSTGTLSGTGFGCTFTGTIAPAPKSDASFSGNVSAAGCDNALFNGDFPDVRLKAEGGRLELRLKREAAGSEVEIEGTLQAAGGTKPPPAQPPVVGATLAGSFLGTLTFTVGTASGSDSSAQLTIGSGGAISGSAFGCTFGGSVTLGAGGTAITGGSVTTAGCTTSALSGTFNQVQLQAEGGNALQVELERETNDVKAVIRGTLQRAM